MAFPERLTALRKQHRLTQQALADQVGVHLSQIRRYEWGEGQPTLDVIRRMAVTLSVSADVLLFDEGERGPQDDDLKLIFEAVQRFTPEEQHTAKEMLQGLIVRYQMQRQGAAKAVKQVAGPKA